MKTEMLNSVKRILVAYTLRNPVIGYCQGMNFILGKIIFQLPEEESFWVFAMLLERILPVDYYSHLVGVQSDCHYLGEDLIRILLPDVYRKLNKFNQSATFFAFNWFVCLFQDKLSDRVSSYPFHKHFILYSYHWQS